ncbi:unnamed protein product, partial [Prorocentrum cordatum]
LFLVPSPRPPPPPRDGGGRGRGQSVLHGDGGGGRRQEAKRRRVRLSAPVASEWGGARSERERGPGEGGRQAHGAGASKENEALVVWLQSSPPKQEQRREGPAASLRHHGALTRQASIRCRGPRRRTLRHRAWHVEAWQDAKASLASRTAATQNAGLAWRRNLPHAARNTGHKQTSAAGTPARAGSDTCHERARIGEDVHSASSTSTRAGPRAILTNARVQPQKEGEGRRGGCRVSPRRRELAARGTSWPSAVWRPAGSPLGHRREGEEEEEEDPREERGERREVSLRRASTRRVQGESPPRASSRRAGHPGPAQCGGPQAARSGIDGGRREEEERREERGGAGRERRNEEGKKACEASLRRVSTRRVQGESPPQASSRPKGNPAPRAVQRPAGSPLGHRRKEEEEKEEG